MDATTREPSRNGSSETPKKQPSTGERGTSYGWGQGAGLTPEDVLGRRPKPSLQDLNHMLNLDGWVQGMHAALTWPIRRLQWSVVEAEGDTGEADEVRAQLNKLMPTIVAGMSQGVAHGVSFAEIVWAESQDRSRLVIEDVAFRPVSTCTPERAKNGRVVGFRQLAYGQHGFVNETFLEVERKAFVYAHDSTTSPGVGRSAFETAYQYFQDKRKVLFYRFKNLEKFGGPSVVGKTNAEGAAKSDFADALNDLRNAGVAALGPDEEATILHAPNAGMAFRQAITDLNFEMAVSTLMQWLALAQEGNSGAYNSSQVQADLLNDATGGRVVEMQDAADVLPRYICEVNFGANAAIPTIRAELIDEGARKTLKEAGDRLVDWENLPAWMRTALPEAYARLFGIEKPENADETVPDGSDPSQGDDSETTNRKGVRS